MKKSEVFIDTVEIDETDSINSIMACMPIMPGIYKRLYVDGEFSMSNAGLLIINNTEVIRKAKGNVLLVGLGVGLVVEPILQKPDVDKVTVLEINKEVISSIAPAYAHPKLNILWGDVYKFETEEMFDTIYFDIWSVLTRENLPDMNALCEKFKNNLNKDGWMECFYRPEMLSLSRAAKHLRVEIDRIIAWAEIQEKNKAFQEQQKNA